MWIEKMARSWWSEQIATCINKTVSIGIRKRLALLTSFNPITPPAGESWDSRSEGSSMNELTTIMIGVIDYRSCV